MTMNRPSLPIQVTAGGGSVGLSIILPWVAGLFGVEMPQEVALAIGSLIAFFAGKYGA